MLMPRDNCSSPTMIEAAAQSMGCITDVDDSIWPLLSSRFLVTARLQTGDVELTGFGAGPSEEIARCRAVMECLERFAQFGVRESSDVITATGKFLGPRRKVSDWLAVKCPCFLHRPMDIVVFGVYGILKDVGRSSIGHR